MRCFSIVILFLLHQLSFTFDKKPPKGRLYGQIDDKRYIKVSTVHNLAAGEHVRFHARLFSDPQPEDFDVIQLGLLEENIIPELEHGGGKFQPKYPFWFERKGYRAELRIVHWPYTNTVQVEGVVYYDKKIKTIGRFQAPIEFKYQRGNSYYLDLRYRRGVDDITEEPFAFFIQGSLFHVYDRLSLPRDTKLPRSNRQPVYVSANCIEAYRSRIGRTHSYHGDTDELIVEPGGYPMPYYASFNPGGLYLGQRAHFVGVFGTELVAYISTPHTTHKFIINRWKAEYNGDKKQSQPKFHANSYEIKYRWQKIRSISFINFGKELAIAFDVSHRFDYTQLSKLIFRDQVIRFPVQWDGPVTGLLLTDQVGYVKSPPVQHDFYFANMSYLFCVDIDNEEFLPHPKI